MGFFGTLLGNDAAKASRQAAADTYAKQTAAANDYKAYGDTLPALYSNLAQGYQPYQQAGTDALSMYRAGLGLGGDQQAFTRAYQGLPGYESGLNTGLTAAQRALNAGHIGQSGAALKGLYRYGSDYENQRVGDYLSRLQGLTGTGLAATGAGIGTQAQGLGAQQNVRQGAYQGMLQSAPTIGQGLVAGAQAQQDALGNLLKTAAYLGGAALGGPAGAAAGKAAGNFFSPSGYGGGSFSLG